MMIERIAWRSVENLASVIQVELQGIDGASSITEMRIRFLKKRIAASIGFASLGCAEHITELSPCA
jgi:hypothetical protein